MNIYCNGENVKKSSDIIELLKQEFDCLGIEVNHNNDTEELLYKAINLIHVHHKTLNQVRDLRANLAKLKDENAKLQRQMEQGERQRNAKNESYIDIQRKLTLLKLENDGFREKNSSLNQQLLTAKAYIKNKENEWKHNLAKLSTENERLTDQLNKNIGTYKSNNEIFTETIAHFKSDAEIYKDTINKLQNNNKDLVEEIVNLRQEFLKLMSEQ